ncbi:MAG: type I methionyl aminopeptidase [Chloroflexi bacterium]|nr:type I methionyl aminopeptidase [Chloroflexota bacterium]MCC6893119.1 type I methionyl aminopeptidase [Anaerolineae bacterium]
MVVQSQRDMAGLVRIGKVVGMTLQKMLAEVRPGITTGELDALGTELLKKEGAKSAPILMYKFPGTTCISINDEAAHGIPGNRVVQVGDLVNIDVSAELDGYYADTAATLPILPVTGVKQKLADVAQAALQKGISVATAGNKVNEIGRAMEGVVRGAGFTVIRDLPGHGVGRKLHESPSVPGFYNPKLKDVLKEGMVLTIEPFVSTKAKHIFTDKDGWTLKTPDGSPAAQYEHTVIITKGAPILITQV